MNRLLSFTISVYCMQRRSLGISICLIWLYEQMSDRHKWSISPCFWKRITPNYPLLTKHVSIHQQIVFIDHMIKKTRIEIENLEYWKKVRRGLCYKISHYLNEKKKKINVDTNHFFNCCFSFVSLQFSW
jgi:hypothetical protein